MSNIKDISKEYLSYQLSVLPTTEDKLPALYSWENLQHKILSKEEIDILFKGGVIRTEIEREVTKKDKTKFIAKGIKSFIDPVGIGIITGAISGSLEVIDVDTKYDLTGSLWVELKALIEGNLPEIYNSLVIAQTKSGGYHIYYKCSQIGSNTKLANRYTTDQEKTIEPNEKVKVLIETRGEGGYVIAPPTIGYKYIQGEPGNIPTITPQQREILFSIAKSFNEVEENKPKEKTTTNNTYNSTGLSPFEDYFNRGEVVSLLESKGWSIVNQQGQRINLKRPGSTDSKTSGNYHTEKRLLRVFSSSTEFNTDKAYTPTEIFILLECNGDKKEAYKKLLDLGYGEPYTTDKKEANSFKSATIELDKDVIIVEGELDSLHATVKGINNIVSTGGSSINSEQIKDAVKRGAKSFTICFDTEPGKEETTAKNINKGIEVILGEGVNKVYIVILPDLGGDKTDLDRLIKERGVEVFKKLIAQAIPYYIYKLECIINKYNSIDNITYKELKSFEEEIVETGASIKEPTDKDSYLKQAINCFNEVGITEESLAIAVDRLTSTRDKEAQAKDFKKLLTEATALQDKGDIDKALELIDSRVKDVRLKDKATEFNSLLLPIKETELRERQTKKPDSLKTGYKIKGEELLLPAGAISIFTAPTSHGKTTFLINLALNVSQAYPDKETYLFSYEEDSDSVLISALNTYLDTPLSGNNRTTLKNYFAGNNSLTLSDNKDKFFKELIDTRRLNIHYSNYNSDTLIEAIRYLHKNTNIGSVFIDYIQLLNLPESKKNRQEQLKEICISLKDLAVETGLPIILGSQFNRTVTNLLHLHATKIGEAGDIERIANLIVGFWNNNFTPIATEGELKEIDSKGGTTKDTIYTTILKQRGGKVGGEELLSFNGNTGKIKNNTTDTTESYFK